MSDNIANDELSSKNAEHEVEPLSRVLALLEESRRDLTSISRAKLSEQLTVNMHKLEQSFLNDKITALQQRLETAEKQIASQEAVSRLQVYSVMLMGAALMTFQFARFLHWFMQ
jgi:hypothetical protein